MTNDEWNYSYFKLCTSSPCQIIFLELQGVGSVRLRIGDSIYHETIEEI